MANVKKTMAAQRAELAAVERAAALKVLASYATSTASIGQRLALLQTLITEATVAGTISPEWLVQQSQWRQLLIVTEHQMRVLTAATTGAVTTLTAEAGKLAVVHAEQISALLTPGVWLPLYTPKMRAVINANMATRRTALNLADVPRNVSDQVAHKVLDGLRQGHNPRKVASHIARDLDVERRRAFLIARTEMMHVYRTETLDAYKDHNRRVTGWTWYAALDERACAVCWAMHGTRHPLDEPMGSHPACRCAMIPDAPTVELTVPGSTMFAKLPNADQVRILGPSKYAAYKAGELTLDDIVGTQTSPVWGTTRRVRPLKDIVGATGAAKFYKRQPAV